MPLKGHFIALLVCSTGKRPEEAAWLVAKRAKPLMTCGGTATVLNSIRYTVSSAARITRKAETFLLNGSGGRLLVPKYTESAVNIVPISVDSLVNWVSVSLKQGIRQTGVDYQNSVEYQYCSKETDKVDGQNNCVFPCWQGTIDYLPRFICADLPVHYFVLSDFLAGTVKVCPLNAFPPYRN